jgi:hypothetical protein
MTANREYKASLFYALFNSKEAVLELYNAVEGTHYDENTPLEINTLEDVFYLGVKNDISFLLDNRLIVLSEHQSTLNRNILANFLRIHNAEVKNMILNYTVEDAIRDARYEGMEQGIDRASSAAWNKAALKFSRLSMKAFL